MELKTTVDLALFDRAALRYIEELGLACPSVVLRISKATNEELMRFTAPRTFAQGRAAVARDIGRAMWVLNPDKIHNRKLRQAVIDEEFDVVQAFMHLREAFPGFKLEHFSPSLHQSKRDRRGRVRKSQKVIVLERRSYNSYVRQIQKHVGATKFGWAISGRRLGVAIPSWVLGHSESHGNFEEDLNPKNPMVAMTNKGPGIDQLGVGFVQRIVDRRTAAMNRDVDQILAGRASRYFS